MNEIEATVRNSTTRRCGITCLVRAVCRIYAENIKFAQTKIFEAGCGCIMLMEISTPERIQEAEAA